MMSNPILIELMVKYRQQAVIEEAEKIRLQRFAKKNNPNRQFRGIERFADLLIRTGEYLKRRFGTKQTGNSRPHLTIDDAV